MLSERNILEQVATIAVVLIILVGTAWLLVDLSQRPWGPQAAEASSWPRPNQPARNAWSENDAPKPLHDLKNDVARAERTGPSAG